VTSCSQFGTAELPTAGRGWVRGLCLTVVAAVLGAAGTAVGQQPADDHSSSAAPSAAPAPAPHKKKAAAAGADDVKSKGSYSIGVMMGTQLRSLGMTSDTVSVERLTQGIRAAMAGAHPGSEDQQNFQALLTRTREAAAVGNKAAARKFLAENGQHAGVQTTPSGLQYKVISEGNGSSPKASDQVTVNYRGTLLDGTEFDSSAKHGQAATFEVDRVIKGWQEALVLMKPGAKWELYIPPDLAYGDNSPPGSPIPPGSLLKFEVELLTIKPPAAPAVPGAAPGSQKPNGDH